MKTSLTPSVAPTMNSSVTSSDGSVSYRLNLLGFVLFDPLLGIADSFRVVSFETVFPSFSICWKYISLGWQTTALASFFNTILFLARPARILDIFSFAATNCFMICFHGLKVSSTASSCCIPQDLQPVWLYGAMVQAVSFLRLQSPVNGQFLLLHTIWCKIFSVLFFCRFIADPETFN